MMQSKIVSQYARFSDSGGVTKGISTIKKVTTVFTPKVLVNLTYRGIRSRKKKKIA
jgi:hypothetical protein